MNWTDIIPAKRQLRISGTAKAATSWRLLLLVVVATLFMSETEAAVAATQQSVGYSRLIELMAAGTSEDPLMALGDYEAGFSQDAHQSNLEYMEKHPDLISTIKTELESTDLSWELIESARRLLAVPEKRSVYADQFEAYCREVIDYVIVATGSQNPYATIITLAEDIAPDLTTDTGITALLVHNLAEEYAYTYAFSGSGQRSLAIELSQRKFIGELGSYTTTLVASGDGTFDFVPNRITVWQNAASNPYSVLMVPVEETLHILLRSSTEQAIRDDLGGDGIQTLDYDDLVDEWVAVEEAIAGGLVNLLLPTFLERHVAAFQPVWIEDDLVEKHQMDRYRYLRQGIRLVRQLGVPEALTLYRENPHQFRKRLLPVAR